MNIGPMHEEEVLGSTPRIPLASFSFSLLKVGIPLVKSIFFNVSNTVRTVLTVFETLKDIDFQGGTPTFENEAKPRQVLFFGCFPGLFLHA